MKRCITSKDFNRFLEDSLDPGSLARLQAHCRECRTCAGKLESWRKLKEKLSTATSIATPDGFKEKSCTVSPMRGFFLSDRWK